MAIDAATLVQLLCSFPSNRCVSQLFFVVFCSQRGTLANMRNRPTSRIQCPVIPVNPAMFLYSNSGLTAAPLLCVLLLQDPVQSKFLVKDVLTRFMAAGGVRLEDNVVVTGTGAESLTDVPRSVEDVEAVMAGAPWPHKA
jgi:hypothetical protein